MQNPCGHTDAEFVQFTKTERRIMRMVHMGMSREQILGSLEIVDSTLRMHLANIKRRQARMRVERAKAATEVANEKLASRFLPEIVSEETMQIETGSRPLNVLRPLRKQEPAPIEHPVSIPPAATVHQESPFVELRPAGQKKKSGFGGFR